MSLEFFLNTVRAIGILNMIKKRKFSEIVIIRFVRNHKIVIITINKVYY